ncbi:MAG: hypothetical protein K2Q24_13430 [Chitinophagaceae bacterium]|jgi:mono/diheme cytochrome c family protein/uncharacterized membrane protein|nr:hypothetical protein [Chitinophagaceae bacterium]
MIGTITEFIGHFHPVLVHLPIGILLLAALLFFLSAKEKYQSLRPAVGISLLAGACSAILSCISGYFLSTTDDYDQQLVFQHQWMGIATAILSVLAYLIFKQQKSWFKWIMILLTLMIIVTGHLGGSLTHGSDYLTASLGNIKNNTGNATLKPIADVQEAVLYADVVQPILQSKCYSCHGSNKQKGKLRLDQQEFILKGGKSGETLVAGKTDESEMIKRILLPKEDDDHMPPVEKPQLSKNDIALINWWVASGADFNKKIKELPQNEKIKPVLLALQSGRVTEEIKISAIPLKPVEKARDSILLKLKAAGIMIVPVAQNSNYLSANFITTENIDKHIGLLLSIAPQLIWLKLGNTKVSDSGLAILAKLPNITRLYLDNTKISDVGLQSVKQLKQLQYINLTGTSVTLNGILQLKELKNLQELYLYKSGVTSADYISLKNIFQKTKIDTGGYKLEMIASDTLLVKPPLGK